MAGITCLTGCPQQIVTMPYSASTTIPLALDTLSVPSANAIEIMPMIPITVGNSSSFKVIFDTGSVGLHVFRSALMTYGDTEIPSPGPSSNVDANYGGTSTSSCDWTGYHATSKVSIGSIDLPTAEPIDVIETASPGCKGELSQANGILGVRPGLPANSPSPGDYIQLPNLMQLLPGNFGSGFIVSVYQSQPIITVGLPLPLPTGYTYVQPTVQTLNAAPGTVYWDAHADAAATGTQGAFSWCLKFTPPTGSPASDQAIATCEPTAVTDSGGLTGRIYFDAAAPQWITTTGSTIPGVSAQGTSPTGTTVTAYLNGTQMMPFTLPSAMVPVDCWGYNDLLLLFGDTPTPSGAEENFGLAPFFENDIMYDFRPNQNLFGVHTAVTIPVAPIGCSS